MGFHKYSSLKFIKKKKKKKIRQHLGIEIVKVQWQLFLYSLKPRKARRTTSYLESTDAAPEVPHPRPTRLPARRTASAFFFFFFFFLGFAPTRLDSRRCGSIRAESASIRARIGLIRPKSGRIGHIGSYRPAANTAETRRKRPKSALNMAGKAETCILLSFFVNQGIVCVF